MSKAITKAANGTARKPAGLSAAEAALIDRLRTISFWIARGLTNAEIVQRIKDQWRGPMGGLLHDQQARDWIIKARQYIAETIEHELETRELYLTRLEDLIDRCQQHLIRDVEEVTVVTGVAEDGEDGDKSKARGGRRVRRRLQKGVFNPGVGNLLFKAMREHAIVSGARPRDNRPQIPAGPNTVNNNTINVAATLATAAPSEVLSMIGGDAFEIIEAKTEADPAGQAEEVLGGEGLLVPRETPQAAGDQARAVASELPAGAGGPAGPAGDGGRASDAGG